MSYSSGFAGVCAQFASRGSGVQIPSAPPSSSRSSGLWGCAPWLRRRWHLLRPPGRLPGQRPQQDLRRALANRDSLWPLLAVIGRIRLKDLTVQDVRAALKKMAATHSTRPRTPLRLRGTTGADGRRDAGTWSKIPRSGHVGQPGDSVSEKRCSEQHHDRRRNQPRVAEQPVPDAQQKPRSPVR